MTTKAEETISQHCNDAVSSEDHAAGELQAMRQHAIDFAEWTTGSGYSPSFTKGEWIDDKEPFDETGYTTEQLYDKFNNQEP